MNNKSVKFIHLKLYATSEPMYVNIDLVKFFHRIPDPKIDGKFKTRVLFTDGTSIEVLDPIVLVADQI